MTRQKNSAASVRLTPLLLALAARAAVGATAAPSAPPAADAPAAAGRIDAVTVYRGQALVTRLIDAPGATGLREVVITNLPERVVPSSLFAEPDGDVEIRGLRFRTRPVSEDVRDDVRKLDAEIRDAQDTIAANQRQQQVQSERRSYLDKLEQFSAPTANVELTKGVLNAETLKALTIFLFEQRQTLANDDLKLAHDQRDAQEKLNLLQRQRDDLTSGASKSMREAVVFADFHKADAKLRLKYLVDSASWSPSYVARTDDAGGAKRRPVTVQYNASIQQMSGEDWTGVTMTLSTATPSLVAAAPLLDPLTITLAAAGPAGPVEDRSRDYLGEKRKLAMQRLEKEEIRNGAFAWNDAIPQSASEAAANAPSINAGRQASQQADADLKGVADQLQVLELIAKRGKDREDRAPDAKSDEQSVSVTYQLPARTSLPSRSDQQSIQIASVEMAGDFYKLATPVLTSYVYDQATITNAGKTVLLAGPVASYVNGQYVGAGTLPTVAAGERFTVGFGVDSSLRASRELVEKSDSTSGGNRVMVFSYRLSVENFGSAPAAVRVTDRLPTSKDDDVKVTLMSTAREPTTQNVVPDTAGGPKRTGITSWTLDVPPAAIGEKAATVEYQYKLEFDKQLKIAGMAK